MKKITTLALIGASVAALSAGAATAQPRGDWNNGPNHSERSDWRGYPGHWTNPQGGAWLNINQRQAELDRRIDQGVRRGTLTRSEAARLRAEFRQIAQLERRYRANGLSMRERADLDARFDRLATRIRWEQRDNQYGYNNRR